MNRRTPWIASAALVAVALMLGVAAIVLWPTDPRVEAASFESPGGTTPGIVAPVLAPRPVVDVPVTSSDPESAPNPADKVQPQQISIPALEVTMPVTPVGLDQDDLLEIPDPVGVAGWYRFSAVPGERDQAILMASHVSSLEEGFGPFSRLGELAIGDTVSVELSDGREVPFVISAREQLSKQVVDFAAITQDSAGMLVLVTCGGEFDYSAGHYDDNIIVWAAPTEVP